MLAAISFFYIIVMGMLPHKVGWDCAIVHRHKPFKILLRIPRKSIGNLPIAYFGLGKYIYNHGYNLMCLLILHSCRRPFRLSTQFNCFQNHARFFQLANIVLAPPLLPSNAPTTFSQIQEFRFLLPSLPPLHMLVVHYLQHLDVQSKPIAVGEVGSMSPPCTSSPQW